MDNHDLHTKLFRWLVRKNICVTTTIPYMDGLLQWLGISIANPLSIQRCSTKLLIRILKDIQRIPKQWVIVHTFDDDSKTSIYIISVITREMGKLKTHSPTYCIMGNWENMLYLTHTLDKIYLTGIFISSMSSHMLAQWWWDGVMNK